MWRVYPRSAALATQHSGVVGRSWLEVRSSDSLGRQLIWLSVKSAALAFVAGAQPLPEREPGARGVP